MSRLDRRDFLRLAAGASAALGTGALSWPLLRGRRPQSVDLARVTAGKTDYRRARAVPTICFGCTTHCGVIGWVQDGRVRRVEGNPLDPNSAGRACSKAFGMIAYTENPERILHPMRRTGPRGSGQWRRISWDEALQEIAERLAPLRESGRPERFVFHYGRDKTKGFTRRFTDAFGTPNRLNRRAICSSNRRVPLMSFYGRDFEWESQDFENTRYILNFGANPMEAHQGGLFMMHRIQRARVERGAKLVTFEVRPSATASVSDEVHLVFPGTDGAIALAMARVILDAGLADEAFWRRWVNVPLDVVRAHLQPYTPEFAEAESGVPAAVIRRIAIEFAEAAPRCTTMSNRGSAKHVNGVQADRAIRMLDVLVGNVGREGGFCLSTLRMWTGKYGQEGLPRIVEPDPRPPRPGPWLPGTPPFEALPADVRRRVAGFPDEWKEKYYGELATPSEYPFSWLFYPMRVGQLVYPYLKEGRQRIDAYCSYTLGASYGYPEARIAREVLKDESLVPFHFAIDIAYSEQAALADLILPEATSLERFDAHSTNSYALRPYTGIRQPLVEPPGEARPLQVILRDIARRIGGGMERYFDFEDPADYYRAWYRELPIPFEEFLRRGIWTDRDRPKDYRLYERRLDEEELADTEVGDDGVIRRTMRGKKRAVGVVLDGVAVRGFPTPSRKIQVYDERFPQVARAVGFPVDHPAASPLPKYHRVPARERLAEGEFVFVTFKWNVHTQGRSGGWKYHSEVIHDNPVFLHPDSATRLGIEEGDTVEVTVYRPAAAGDGRREAVGSFRNRVRLLAGVHPRVAACSHHVGHFEHGLVATAGERSIPSAAVDRDALPPDADVPGRLWWSKGSGGPGGGVYVNDALPIDPSPLVGGQNWFDAICRVRKVT